MFNSMKAIRGILKRKNMQIRAEREKLEAERATNVILSAYIALLVSKRGSVRIPKKEVSEALGRFVTCASSCGDDYVIEVGEIPGGADGRGNCVGKAGRV